MFELAEAEKCLTLAHAFRCCLFRLDMSARHVDETQRVVGHVDGTTPRTLPGSVSVFPAKGLDGFSSVDVSGDTFLQLAHHTDASLVFVGPEPNRLSLLDAQMSYTFVLVNWPVRALGPTDLKEYAERLLNQDLYDDVSHLEQICSQWEGAWTTSSARLETLLLDRWSQRNGGFMRVTEFQQQRRDLWAEGDRLEAEIAHLEENGVGEGNEHTLNRHLSQVRPAVYSRLADERVRRADRRRLLELRVQLDERLDQLATRMEHERTLVREMMDSMRRSRDGFWWPSEESPLGPLSELAELIRGEILEALTGHDLQEVLTGQQKSTLTGSSGWLWDTAIASSDAFLSALHLDESTINSVFEFERFRACIESWLQD